MYAERLLADGVIEQSDLQRLKDERGTLVEQEARRSSRSLAEATRPRSASWHPNRRAYESNHSNRLAG
jgi:hypothetical protein